MDFKAKMATGAVGGSSLVAATNILAEMLDGYFKAHGFNYDINTVEVVVATLLGFIAGGPVLVLSEIVRQATLKGMAKLGIDLTKILGNGVTVLFVCLALGGCKSIPVASEGSATDQKVEGKGGTIACDKGFSGTMDPTGEWLAAISCGGKLVWSDPPTPEEMTVVEKAVAALMHPFDTLAEAGARLIPGGK